MESIAHQNFRIHSESVNPEITIRVICVADSAESTIDAEAKLQITCQLVILRKLHATDAGFL